MTSNTPWLTPVEAAQRARRHKSAILEALRSQELRGYQAVKRGRWLIHIDDLDAWVRGETAPVEIPAITRTRRLHAARA